MKMTFQNSGCSISSTPGPMITKLMLLHIKMVLSSTINLVAIGPRVGELEHPTLGVHRFSFSLIFFPLIFFPAELCRNPEICPFDIKNWSDGQKKNFEQKKKKKFFS